VSDTGADSDLANLARHLVGGGLKPEDVLPSRDSFGELCHTLSQLNRVDPHFVPHADGAIEVQAEIGEGGMGLVYRVHDHRLNRTGALKTIRPECLDERTKRRFRREAELTAQLDHPSIPPVYEAGTNAAGQHYMLMRLIEGQPLSDCIEEARASGQPAALTPLLEALVKVGEAVGYAHSQGVVHRDLKPSNVMVGAFGEVMVMDWGLARRLYTTDDMRDSELYDSVIESAPEAGLTQAGTILGTLGYMPPEQADGQPVDPRADVFALGAILCEILSGEPPINGKDWTSLLMATAKEEIRTPLEIDPSVPPELDAIAADALEGDVKLRTPTAERFVADLRAYLLGQDVNAYHYGPHERLLRAARRHPAALIGAIGLALVSALLTALALVSTAKERAELDARVASQREDAAVEREQAAVDRQREVEAAKRVFDSALTLLAEAEDLGDRGRVEEATRRIERALSTVWTRQVGWLGVKAYESAGLYPEADRLLERLAEEFWRADPPPYRELYQQHLLRRHAYGPDLAEPLARLLELADANGDVNEFVHLGRAFEAISDLDYGRAERLCSEAIQLNPRLTVAYVNRAMTRRWLGRYQEALGDAEFFLTTMPTDPLATYERAMSLLLLGRRQQGRVALQQAFDLARKQRPNHPPPLKFLQALVTELETDEPERALHEAARAVKAYPNEPRAWLLLAEVQCAQGHHEPALESVARCLALDPRSAKAYALRGTCHGTLRRFEDAEADFRRALELQPKLPDAWMIRARFRKQQGDVTGAIADLDQALGLTPGNAALLAQRAECLVAAQEFSRALRDTTRILEETTHPPAEVLNLHGAVLYYLGRYAEAVPIYERAIAAAPEAFNGHFNLGEACEKLGRLEEALGHSSRAIAIQPHPDAFYLRGRVLTRLGRTERARPDWTRFLEQAHANDPRRAEARAGLGR
jgi:tetratricopeptide (TPR) repeat protein/tRNA A-37 threonylcarbamoyl transferase component Bud32